MKYGKIWVCILIIFIIIVTGVFVNKYIEDKYFESIKFSLLGPSTITLYEGDEYVEPSFIVYDDENTNLSEYVIVTGNVLSNKVGNYSMKYILKIKNNVKTLERKINIISDPLKELNININGDKNTYHIVEQAYVDKGCYVTDLEGKKRDDIEILVENNVNSNVVGTYEVIYKIIVDDRVKSTTRTVFVYDTNLKSSYSPNSNTEGIVDILITTSMDEKIFKQIVLPNGVITDKQNISYPVIDNGTYKFEIHDKYNNVKIHEVVINNIDRTYSCSGTISRYGTNVKLVTNYKDNIKSYKWNLDGKINVGTENFVDSRHAYDKISLELVFSNGNTKEIDCNIDNTLIYRFNEKSDETFYKCDAFTQEDKVKYDDMLARAVQQAGYGTRAGVVEALRFLMGGLGYRLAYDGHHSTYNKIGLNIGNSKAWGCRVDGYIRGMDCTGIYWWPMYQNGVKSVSPCTPINVYPLRDVVDRVRVGDVLVTPDASKKEMGCYYAHATIIIGIDENNIYAGSNGVIVIPKNNIPVKGSNTHVRFVEYPNGDGNLTNMWVS